MSLLKNAMGFVLGVSNWGPRISYIELTWGNLGKRGKILNEMKYKVTKQFLKTLYKMK